MEIEQVKIMGDIRKILLNASEEELFKIKKNYDVAVSGAQEIFKMKDFNKIFKAKKPLEIISQLNEHFNPNYKYFLTYKGEIISFNFLSANVNFHKIVDYVIASNDSLGSKKIEKCLQKKVAPKTITINLTVLNILKRKLAKTLPAIVDDACDWYCDIDEMPTQEEVKDLIGEMMNGCMYEEDFVNAFDFVAKYDNIDIKKNDSADYVWSKYENEIDMLLSAAAKDAYAKLNK